MPGANREDAIRVVIFRDGKVFFGSDQAVIEGLPAQIRESLNRGAERRVYISADKHVYYRTVREVLDRVRMAGVENVSFLVNQRQSSTTQ
jgi:biopolymer transport protein ExbD